jgi:hypothetical protein
MDLLKLRLGLSDSNSLNHCLWHVPSPRGFLKRKCQYRPVHRVEPALVDRAMHYLVVLALIEPSYKNP